MLAIFYSHLGKDLRQHLAGVATEVYNLLQTVALPQKEEFLKAAVIAGAGHDFGKFTTYFQDYLLKGQKDGDKHQHAFISGIWTAFLVQRLLGTARADDLASYLPLLSFFAVVRHHGNLDCPKRHLARKRELLDPGLLDLEPGLAHKLKLVGEQIEDLAKKPEVKKAFAEALRSCAIPSLQSFLEETAVFVEASYEEFLDNWRDYYASLFTLGRALTKSDENLKETVYYAVLALFSALIDADKRDAGAAAKILRRVIPADSVDTYRKKHFGFPEEVNQINLLRERLYENVCQRVEKVPLTQHLFTLTAPTGSGKTLSSLAAALALRRRIADTKGYSPRIIYSLPFTNIIDQTYTVFHEVFEEAIAGFKAQETVYLLKHHYLADIAYQAKSEEDLSVDKALLMIESWQSEVIVTTFVQLLSTLIGYRNRMLKKFNKLAGAIIILDEVQNLPVEYWHLIEQAFMGAVRHLGCYIILMTATKPLLFTNEEVCELAGGETEVEGFFEHLNRVELEVDLAPCSLEKACEDFARDFQQGKSYLFVANTIKSSLAIYNLLEKELLKKGLPKNLLYYLSTNIVPLERRKRIEEIADNLKKGPVVVSTQVVEAGVDLDFQEVWRDLGPVDSIVQVAGRCNRNSSPQKGRVRVLHLVDEKGHSFAKRIYGSIHYQNALKILGGQQDAQKMFSEQDFFRLVHDFFQLTVASKSKDQARQILQAMYDLNFSGVGEEETSIANFSLIKQFVNYSPVFVEMDAAAQELWDIYKRRVWQETDMLKRRSNFLAIKKDFYDRVISVPNKFVLDFYDSQAGITPVRLPLEILEDYYEAATGFKRTKANDAIIF